MSTDAGTAAAGGEPAPDAPGSAGTPGTPPDDRTHHWWRLITIWVVLSVILDLLYYFLVGPHVPPGTMTSTAGGAQFDFNVLLVIALPVLLGVWIYMLYAIIVWRASRGGSDPVGGEKARGNLAIQTGWIITTTVIVLFLAGFGTYELVQPEGAGSGQGPIPIWTPTSHTVLPIQVIGQQWKFTYRYPTFGGFETNQLVVPDHTTIAFHVTSLDVVHSFWAYQLGVKADANPGQDNVAFTTTKQLGQFTVRCAELCGIW
ncbi:MAG TPA: cytochrome c oxidase subunit II, partial [Acidimicrobiales bacterium]|nr:cytochrome c oxidase subunit II [Acidimicrobiales bacterium]